MLLLYAEVCKDLLESGSAVISCKRKGLAVNNHSWGGIDILRRGIIVNLIRPIQILAIVNAGCVILRGPTS